MHKLLIKILTLTLGVYFILQLTACEKDPIISTNGQDLIMEVDTLLFDTVFTDMGSATRKFKVYNPANRRININRIYLVGGEQSDFHLNIDGKNVLEVEDLEIPANDSIYIFANVRIDPNNGDMIRKDSIIFETDGGAQKVNLEAFGWTAIYHGVKGEGRYINPSGQNMTLTPDTPHVMIGYVYVYPNTTLTIPAGTEIFMYGGPTTRPAERALLIVDSAATLKVNVGGDLNNPVEFKTHRLEDDYQDLPFQYSGIYLTRYSVDNQIHGCIIRNAVDGIVVDGPRVNANPKLDLKKSMIFNVDRACILSFQGDIEAENTVLANSNTYNFVSIQGGRSHFNHCSLVNFGTNPFVGRNEPIVSLRDFYRRPDDVIEVGDLDATFDNCIIYGSRAEEVEAFSIEEPGISYDFEFNYCLMQLDTFSQNLNNCIFNQDPYFEDVDEYLYRPDSSISPLIGNANPATSLLDDIESTSRSQNTIGAYEWVP
jgi:hypothetical protein